MQRIICRRFSTIRIATFSRLQPLSCLSINTRKHERFSRRLGRAATLPHSVPEKRSNGGKREHGISTQIARGWEIMKTELLLNHPKPIVHGVVKSVSERTTIV